MNKKLLVLALILCLTFSVLAMVACNKDTGDETESDNYTETSDNTDTEVTADEWRAAFGKELTAITLTQKFSDTEAANVLKYDLINNRHFIQSYDIDSDKLIDISEINAKIDDKYYYFYKEADDNWQRFQTDQDYFTGACNTAKELIASVFTELADKFGLFTNETHAYVAQNVNMPVAFEESFTEVKVYFENGILKKANFSNEDTQKPSFTIECGVADIAIPAEYDDVLLNVRGGSYYLVSGSPTGWGIIRDAEMTFMPQGKLNLSYGAYGSYEIKSGYIKIDFVYLTGNDTMYAVIDGNLLWFYNDINDIGNYENAAMIFYEGTELSAGDLEKITALTGSVGIVTDDSSTTV